MKILDQYEYHTFLKIKRKYYKRHCIKRIDHFNGKRFVSYWEKEDWIGYVIQSYLTYSLDESMSKEVKLLIGEDLYNDSLDKVKDLYDNIWKQYKFYYDNPVTNERNEYIGYFIGVILTNRDAYFLASDKQYSKDKNDYQLVPMWWNVKELNE
jgi:hypothetical protein